MAYHQGDIVLVPFPLTDQTGHVVRPAIVISNSTVNRTEDVILAQITTNNRGDEFSYVLPNTHITRPWNPPVSESYVRCHKIATTSKSIIRRQISAIKNERLNELITQVKSFLE